MPSGPLIPDTPLQFSAELAAVIGLEEAILLQQVKTVYRHQPATRRDGLAWLHVSHAYLQELLPFWDLATLLRVCDSLVELGLLRSDRERAARDCLLLAIDDQRAVEAPARSPREHADASRAQTPSRPQTQAEPPRAEAPRAGLPRTDLQRDSTASSAATTGRSKSPAPRSPRTGYTSGQGEPLPRDFTPSEDMLELLERFHGVPRAFALAQLEDFTLYWRERGSAGHAWQNRFKQHVQWHWKRQQQEAAGVGHGGEQGSGGARRTRDSSLEHDLTDTTWAD